MMPGALLLGSILTIASRYGVLADKARAWAGNCCVVFAFRRQLSQSPGFWVGATLADRGL
jgi:hypothetical protein